MSEPNPVSESEAAEEKVVPLHGPPAEPSPDGAPTAAGQQVGPSTVFTGELLRQLREERGVELKTISEKTRIGARSLAALEEERFEDLPDVRVYIRGFICCYAQEIGLDPDQVAKSYLERWSAWAPSEKNKSKPGVR